MDKKHFCLLSIAVNIFLSCSYSNPNHIELLHPGQESLLLQRTDSLLLPLDDVTPNITYASCFNDSTNIFYFFGNDHIVAYDITTGARLRSIPVEKEHIKRLSSFNVLTDRCITVADYDGQSICCINRNGALLSKTEVNREIDLPLMGASPIFNLDERYYFTSKTSDNACALISLDKKDNRINAFLPYPGIYKYNWGTLLLRIPYACHNKESNCITVSFPAEHFLYSFNCGDNSIEKKFAGSKYIKETVPIHTSAKKEVDNETELKHYARTGSYSNILYDRFNRVYYRIAELKTGTFSKIRAKPLSVIILDKEFQILGETLLNDRFIPTYRYTPFVSENGLHLQLISSEEEIIFGIYKLIKNE